MATFNGFKLSATFCQPSLLAFADFEVFPGVLIKTLKFRINFDY